MKSEYQFYGPIGLSIVDLNMHRSFICNVHVHKYEICWCFRLFYMKIVQSLWDSGMLLFRKCRLNFFLDLCEVSFWFLYFFYLSGVVVDIVVTFFCFFPQVFVQLLLISVLPGCQIWRRVYAPKRSGWTESIAAGQPMTRHLIRTDALR